MSLPDPATLEDAVERATGENAGTPRRNVNVAVHGTPDPAAVEVTDEGYVGDAAGPTGRLAAALAVAEDRESLSLRHPDPDFTADGPWLVLAPLAGFLTTVATGVGRVEVTTDYDPDADPTFERFDSLVDDLVDAARPRHDHYPVADDRRGVFTAGMTTFSLDSLRVEDGLRATFAASTTPSTTGAAIESRFEDLDAVRAVEYDPVAGVERARPSPRLRKSVETAHREVAGDAQYDWLREGGVFARIPGSEKVAFGAGAPGAETFSREAYATCVDLLDATRSELEATE